jgi:hypothetical protein
MGVHDGVNRTRKLWSAQPISMTMSRIPAFHPQMVALSMRQRLTRLLTCSMRTRRREIYRLRAFWTRVNTFPRGFFMG